MGSHPVESPLGVQGDDNMALHDSAFEPLSSFMFEDSEADEEFRNMQRNIESLDVLADEEQSFPSSATRPQSGGVAHGMNGQYHQAFMNPFSLKRDSLGPQSPTLPTAPPFLAPRTSSTQDEIIDGRSVSVAHQFGQITPPDDATPEAFAAAPCKSTKVSSQAHVAVSSKSERARNAANQRHAKAKKARKDRGQEVDSTAVEDNDVDEDRRERYREKNRLAAAKCRAKKKVNTEDLEESARQASAQNNKLRTEERELRDLFSSLRDQALAHDPSQGCGCRAIHSYNLHKARETARGTMGLHGLVIPSPMQRSIDSNSPSTVGVSSRAQSFSETKPQFSKHSARSQSFGDPMDYMASTGGNMLQQSSSAMHDLGHAGFEFTHDPTHVGEDDFAVCTHRSSDEQQLYHG